MGDIGSSLIPYNYQEEVFRRAQKENIIAALNTGSGKTLISILLIKWIAVQEMSREKAIIFLVPKVTLVDQQAESIGKYTSLRIVKLFGAMELELNNRAGWEKKLKNHDVFVMTAQIFLNLITHGIWNIQKVSLMIFDECHHARKNHPFNSILREYHQVQPSQRPKIFGMTASPIWNTKNPHGSILELESNMDAKVIGIHANISELEKKAPKPEERIENYPFPPDSYDCPLSTLFPCLALVDGAVWARLGIPLHSSLETRYLNTLGNLGPYCASLFLYFEIQQLLLSHRQSERMPDFLSFDDSTPVVDPVTASEDDEIKFVSNILEDFQPFFPLDAMSQEIPIEVRLEWCTPKMKVLVDLLLEFEGKYPTFQCVIFVEQRQVASTLSKVLQVIPELKHKIKSAFLVGQGVNSDGVSKLTDRYRGDPVKMFKDGLINVLVATSVAEEGLDFKACDLVIRFDGIHHMVSYVQSRGRARKKASTFVVMVPEGQEQLLSKYVTMRNNEESLSRIYRTRHLEADDDEEDDYAGDEAYSLDLVDRERYVVTSTGAVLTYDNSLHLLGLLCSQIPRDAFTPAYNPVYKGEFQSTLYLPRVLPIPPEHLVFHGPRKHSKKEAKRAVAYMAVLQLRQLDVFDEYLLPSAQEESIEHPRRSAGKFGNTPAIMPVRTRDPWCIGPKLWFHRVAIDGRVVAGLVTGTKLPSVEVAATAFRVSITCGEQLYFEEPLEHHQRRLMEDFTKLSIFYNITSRPFTSRLSLYLVPITQQFLPDFNAMEHLVSNPRGSTDWDQVSETHNGRLMVMCRVQFGSMHILHKIRHDLTPMSQPGSGSPESECSTYREYWIKKWSKKRREVNVSTEGPIIEAWRFHRSHLGSYPLSPSDIDFRPVQSVSDHRFLPQGDCAWLPISYDVHRAYCVLSALCQRVTHVCRAQSARLELRLPLIPDNLLIEALTIPSATFPFNNQRLETLGDAVLQLCTTVHLFHHFPHRHEGQLSKLRQKYVSNQYLLQRALDTGLESYINCEIPNLHNWRYVLSGEEVSYFDDTSVPVRYVQREYPRRSLQDCMEAILGASFLTGGIPMALQTGTGLGLEFGGPLPWFVRYPHTSERKSTPPLFVALEERLGYQFRHQHLMHEALTHPSSAPSSEGQWYPSFQRLEFLGDAILDLVVVRYLYDKFPKATSHQLSLPRSKAICSPTLAYLAVKRLGVHKMMLVDSFDLNLAIADYVPVLDNLTAEDIVKTGWRYDPPKALSDVFESVMGAVLVDSGHDYDKTAAVMEHVMEEVLEVLSPAIAKDPVSELLEWLAGQGCRLVSFQKRKHVHSEREGVLFLLHDNIIAGPVFSTTNSRAKFAVAERAMAILRDTESEKCLRRLCTCAVAMQVDNQPESTFSRSDFEDFEDDKEVAAFLSQIDLDDDI